MPSKAYTLSSLKILLTTVYHTNDRKYIFKLHLKKSVGQVLLQVAPTTYISEPFYEQANLPQNLHYFYIHMP